MKACSHLEMDVFFAYNCFLLVAFVCNVSHLPKAGQHLSKRCHNLLLWCPEIQKHYSTGSASASANHSTTGISSCGMICRCSSTSQQYPANSNKCTLKVYNPRSDCNYIFDITVWPCVFDVFSIFLV